MVAPSTSTLEAEKLALRQRLKALRAGIKAADAAQRASEHFAGIPVPPLAAIGGYWPVGDEFSPLPLLRRLAASGHPVGLPVVTESGRPLVFRQAPLDRPPPAGKHGIPAPGPEAPVVIPALLLVPLLGFDAAGWRLGYGGGYYDRTIAALRAAGGVITVGLAFAAQEINAAPHGPHDMRLDWIVTEREARRFL